MNHKNEPYTNVPELRERVMEAWYEQEWGVQEDGALSAASPLQAFKTILQPGGFISRLLHPVSNSEPIVRPSSKLETETSW